ncbi:hypothetical protein BDZ94DRAFT_1374995 [Collybia nuda]|uniref:Pre-rRNA-processing protein n=1 Tax=Collybia nuda TaxID=64659 RepID=A0A9P6CCM8_9AGAR|nr:hypothetical protein BDZ94DRAFT_1374995 [Collybia nuda]
MPKSAKKRKDKAADFSKAKLKLGRGKQVASNVVDTSFKARSIVLPTQRIALSQNDSVPTTRRGLTLDDLLVHLKHHNAGTRKDAIVGLRELLDSHRELLDSSLTALVNGSVRAIGDEDADVRKGLLTFFSWLFPRIPKEDLVPHTPLLLLFTTSAQTHIFPEIRIDAIRFLNIILEHIPQTVVTGWGGGNNGHGFRILEGYLGILNAGTNFGETDGTPRVTSTASVILTSGSKLIVLDSLETFLRHALSSISSISLSDKSPTLHSWYLLSSFLNQEAYHSFSELLQPGVGGSKSRDHRYWQPEVETGAPNDNFPRFISSTHLVFGGHQTLSDLFNRDTIANLYKRGIVNDTNAVLVARLARALHPTLVATFLDCAPSVFAPNSNLPDTEVQLIVAVVRIVHILYNAIMQNPVSVPKLSNSTSEDLKNFLGYMSPYFPFRLTGSYDAKQAFQDVNLVFCELTSLLLLENEKELVPVVRLKGKQGLSSVNETKVSLSIQILRVSEYVIQLLRGESIVTRLGKPLTAAAYLALLPTIWALLNDVTATHRSTSSDVLKATVEHALKASSKSALKQMSIEFIAQLVLLNTEPHYKGYFLLGRNTEEDQKLEDWVTHLPQTLWELGSSNLLVTETIFRFLLIIIHRKSSLIHAKTIASLQSKLVPYFIITHAIRGNLPGPYTKLPTPSYLRRLALDLVVTINQGHVHDDALSVAVDIAVDGTKEQAYWAHIQKSIHHGI